MMTQEQWPSPVGLCPATPWSSTTVPHLFNKREALTTAQGVDSLSSSLLNHVDYLPQRAGPNHKGNMPGELRFIWDHQKDHTLIIVNNLTDLYSQYHKAEGVPCATQPNQIEGVANKVLQQQHRELMLVHIIGHHCVHLTATVCQSVDLPTLTRRLTRVSGPTPCAVGPSANSEKA